MVENTTKQYKILNNESYKNQRIMSSFIFFFELAFYKLELDKQIEVVDDTKLEEHDQENLPYSRLKDLCEVIDRELIERLQIKMRNFIDDLNIEKFFITICEYHEFPFQWAVIIFSSEYNEADIIEEIPNFTIVIDTTQFIIRRARFISTFFIAKPMIEKILEKLRNSLNRLKIKYGPLSYRDMEGSYLNFRGFLGEIPIYRPIRIEKRILYQIYNFRKEFFPTLLAQYKAEVIGVDFIGISKLSEPNMMSEYFQLIDKYLKEKTIVCYSNLALAIQIFTLELQNLFLKYSNANRAELIVLLTYFKEMESQFSVPYPTIMFHALDIIALNYSTADNLGRVNFSRDIEKTYEFKERRHIYNQIKMVLMNLYQFRKELENAKNLLSRTFLERKTDEMLVIFDTLNQGYFLSRRQPRERIKDINDFISKIQTPTHHVYRYIFITQDSFSSNPHAITDLHNSGWNLIDFLKDKKEDYDTRLVTFVEELNKLKIGDWSDVLLLSLDSDLITNFLIKFKSNLQTNLYIITSSVDPDSTNMNLESIDNFGLDLKVYKMIR